MILGFGNNVVSSLASDITASQTTIPVLPGDGQLFARLLTSDFSNKSTTLKNYAKITLTDSGETAFEICHLTAVSGDTLTVVRGQEGTTAKGWVLKDVVANFATRGSENAFPQIAHIQSGFYTSGSAGGTANALTLDLPTTFFLNGSVDWVLKTPIIVYPSQNNTGEATLQLTMGGRVLGNFPLYKGNKAALVANDILKDVALVCLMDQTKTFFSVANPGAIYAGLGSAAFKDVVTSTTDATAGRIPTVGWMGLGGGAVPMVNDDIISPAGVGSRFFYQGGGAGSNYFGTHGVGIHLNYGVSSGGGAERLTANAFIGSDGNLAVEWLSIEVATGEVVSRKLQKLYGPLNKPSPEDIGAVPNTRKVNGRALSGDIELYPSDIFQLSAAIGNSANLNNYTTPGLYYQPANAQAQTGTNYPEAIAGSLEVYKHAGITQIYRIYNSSRCYIRTLYGGTWSSWVKQYDAANPPPATDLSGYYTKTETDARYNLKNTASIGQNGWERDGTTGLIRQWGYTNQTSGYQNITFPLAFPNACRNIHVTPYTANIAGTLECSVSQYSNTTARLNANQNFPLFWEATGN